MELRHLYETYVINHDVSWATYSTVSNAIRDAFGVDPRLLRPDDPLKLLFDLDTWRLGHGSELLNRLLEERFRILRFDKEPTTFGELLIKIEHHVRTSKPNDGSRSTDGLNDGL